MNKEKKLPSGVECSAESCAKCRARCVPNRHGQMMSLIAERKARAASHTDKAEMLVVEQYASQIRCSKRQRLQLKSLGLGRMWKRVTLPAIPSVTGLIACLPHLVRIVKE